MPHLYLVCDEYGFGGLAPNHAFRTLNEAIDYAKEHNQYDAIQWDLGAIVRIPIEGGEPYCLTPTELHAVTPFTEMRSDEIAKAATPPAEDAAGS